MEREATVNEGRRALPIESYMKNSQGEEPNTRESKNRDAKEKS